MKSESDVRKTSYSAMWKKIQAGVPARPAALLVCNDTASTSV